MRELETGDVFVLRWWLDDGPTIRHYLVARKEGKKLFILRLESDSTRLSEIDCDMFNEHMDRREIMLVDVYKADQTSSTISQ